MLGQDPYYTVAETVGTGGWLDTASEVAAHSGSRPRILLAASTWWPASARLALALIRAGGCEVSAICPPGHPLRCLTKVRQFYRINAFRSQQSLLDAIIAATPDAIVPCDDRIVSQLHELFALHPRLRPLIEFSLGDPSGFSITDSRSKLLKVATDLGIRVPETFVLKSEVEAEAAFEHLGPIAVMKLDGTHGGEGVRIVRSKREAAFAFRSLRRGTGMLTAARRLLIYSDPLSAWSWTRRNRSEVVLQKFIDGKPANNMMASWRGELLGAVSVECLCCQGPTGSASVVRRIEQPEMLLAARLLAAHLKISGFFGLDFMIDSEDGKPYLIEMNPRCTQLGHLQFSETGDLAGALCERLTGRLRPPPETPIYQNTIAFYPQAWVANRLPDKWHASFQDIPWQEPSLVNYLKQPPWPDRRWLSRTYRLARGRKS